MKTTRAFVVVFATAVLWAGPAVGQTAPTNVATSTPTNAPPAAATNETEKSWSVSVSAYTYVVPDDDNYVQPTIAVDHERLHLELRYNYEALKTGSAWDFASKMGPLVASVWMTTLAVMTAAIIIGLNVKLVFDQAMGEAPLAVAVVAALAAALAIGGSIWWIRRTPKLS